jgi:GNAT superfamily N-acetyltransferase
MAPGEAGEHDVEMNRHAPPDGLREVALRHADEGTLVRFHSLMTLAFPPEEGMTYEELIAARKSTGTNGTLLLDGDVPVAGMVTEDYLDGRVVLLAYLVVAAPARNGGLGSQLVSRPFAPEGAREPPVVLAEIEDPRFHPSNSFGDPVARVRFYDRAGAQLLPLPYCQPSLRPGSPRVDNMLLIAIGAPEPHLEGTLVADFLEEYYVACEGEETVHSDPAFIALRDKARGDEHGRVPLHPLAALDAVRPDPEPPGGTVGSAGD